MSGSIDLSSLYASGGGSSDLLSILYGGGAGPSAASALAALDTAERNQNQDIAATAAQPAVARDIATFRSVVASAKTPADVLANPTALKVLLTANGLASQADYPALAQKVLTSNINDPNALVNQLGSSGWTSTVKTFNFANQGLANLTKPGVVDTIANGYAEIVWRQSLDATTPGLSSALTFRAEASTVTNADQILGDPVLRDVITTALGIPPQIAFQDIGAQEQAINSRLNFSRLQDPAYVDGLTQQYLTAKAASATTGPTDIFSLATRLQGLTV